MTKWLPVLIFPLVLAGCGGGDKKPPTELNGKLQGGAIQGVAWRTATRSGVTDADGRFAYLPGETVTFSLGDVQLGAAPGSTDITLFTLAGLTPPTTERALRRELDRAMRMSTPFTCALNLDLLLIALDADSNPDNGVDVRNRESALHGVTLQLDLSIGEFANRLYSRVPSLTQTIPMFKPAVHLYRSLGLRVPVHAQSRVLTENSLGPTGGTQTFAYLASGLIQAEDGDRDGDGVVDSHIGYQYDAYGRVTDLEYSFDNDVDHVVDQHYTSAYRFDSRGTITGFVQTSDDFGGRATATLVERAVDAFGRTTRQVVDIDAGSDGSVDERQVETTEYDAARKRGVFTRTTDVGNDGVIDSISRSTEIDDAKGRVLSAVWEIDEGADGVIDSRDTIAYVHDDVARTTRYVDESDVDGDGTADRRSISTWQLDRAGNVIAQTYSSEPLANGVIQDVQSFAREFDAARRATKVTYDQDWNGDGILESTQTSATTYDDLGNVTRYTNDFDGDMDGQWDAHLDEGSEYGRDGELLATASHYDFDGDGLTDIRSGITVENTVVDDGVLLLTNWYFRTRYSSASQ